MFCGFNEWIPLTLNVPHDRLAIPGKSFKMYGVYNVLISLLRLPERLLLTSSRLQFIVGSCKETSRYFFHTDLGNLVF